MATRQSDIIQWATTTANVDPQGALVSQAPGGFIVGSDAPSGIFNKVFRQHTAITSALAQFVADQTQTDILDTDPNVVTKASFYALLLRALRAAAGTAANLVTVSAPLSGTTAFNFNLGSIFLYTSNATGNFIFNLTGDGSSAATGTFNQLLATNTYTTFRVVTLQGATPYFHRGVFQIDGQVMNQTFRWQGPTAPTAGSPNGWDVYSFLVMKTADNMYSVTGQLVSYDALVSTTAFSLTQSLRLRATNSGYLTRTPAVASNQLTWTWSGWVKRGTSGGSVSGALFTSYVGIGNGFQLRFVNDQLMAFSEAGSANAWIITTTALFRDPAAWYHVVLSFDTTQTAAANRVRLYINGVQVSAFATATYPSQNYQDYVNRAIAHGIGARVLTTPDNFFDGVMTDINFVDGLALTPAAFATTNNFGAWTPIAYFGQYGTNGFYLNMQGIRL